MKWCYPRLHVNDKTILKKEPYKHVVGIRNNSNWNQVTSDEWLNRISGYIYKAAFNQQRIWSMHTGYHNIDDWIDLLIKGTLLSIFDFLRNNIFYWNDHEELIFQSILIYDAPNWVRAY